MQQGRRQGRCITSIFLSGGPLSRLHKALHVVQPQEAVLRRARRLAPPCPLPAPALKLPLEFFVSSIIIFTILLCCFLLLLSI
jgi:hypothetical protein